MIQSTLGTQVLFQGGWGGSRFPASVTFHNGALWGHQIGDPEDPRYNTNFSRGERREGKEGSMRSSRSQGV